MCVAPDHIVWENRQQRKDRRSCVNAWDECKYEQACFDPQLSIVDIKLIPRAKRRRQARDTSSDTETDEDVSPPPAKKPKKKIESKKNLDASLSAPTSASTEVAPITSVASIQLLQYTNDPKSFTFDEIMKIRQQLLTAAVAVREANDSL